MSPWHSNKGQLGGVLFHVTFKNLTFYQLLRKVTPPMTEVAGRGQEPWNTTHAAKWAAETSAHFTFFHSFIPPLRTCSVTCIWIVRWRATFLNLMIKSPCTLFKKYRFPGPTTVSLNQNLQGKGHGNLTVTSTLSYERLVRNDWSLCLGELSGLIALWI